MPLPRTSLERDNSHITTVYCDVCDKEVIGNVWAYGDLMVCLPCHHFLRGEDVKKKAQEIRAMPNVPWKTLVSIVIVAAGTGYVVESWPLVDGIAWAVGGCATVGLALKALGRLRG